MTQHVSEPVNEGTVLRMRGFRQGDVLPAIRQIAVFGSGGPEVVEAPMGVVIVTQTCDVIRDGLRYVHVAPRQSLPEEAASQARKGRRPRYAHLPAIGERDFADLTQVCSVRKGLLVQLERVPGVSSDEDISKFGKAVGRHFNRFAFPDEVNKFLNPLADAIQSKSGKTESPEGRLIEHVLQLRIESVNGWQAPPYDLRLVIIVVPGTLPMFADNELPMLDDGLAAWLYDSAGGIRQSAHEIAMRLESTQASADRFFLWSALGDAWVARCGAKGVAHGSPPGIAAEVVPADEFSLERMLDSELLDLDHLSQSDGQPV